MAENENEIIQRPQLPELDESGGELHVASQKAAIDYVARAFFSDPNAGPRQDANYDAEIDGIAAKARAALEDASTVGSWKDAGEQTRDYWRNLVEVVLDAAGEGRS